MPKRSKIALLERTREIIMGKSESSVGDSGWRKGAYHDGITVCLNAALRIAEHDVFVIGDVPDGDDWYSRSLQTDEGVETQRILVQAIYGFYNENHDGACYDIGYVRSMDPTELHQQIVEFNDSDGREQGDMNDVLVRAEKISYERWIEDNVDMMPTNMSDRPFAAHIAQPSI
jgi:hypothetical protein